MRFLSKIKLWLKPQQDDPQDIDIAENNFSDEEESELLVAPIVKAPALSEEEEQFAQVKQFVQSDDIGNHQLAAMFMAGLGMQWDDEMYEMVARSAEKMIFWAGQENNESFLRYFTRLVITPRFFGQYSEIAEFAEILPEFKYLKELKWNAKHYWNQHPILNAASKLPELKRLFAEGCRMNFLPESLSEAPVLEELYLSGNRLTEMPESFNQLLHLRILDLSNNNFKTCPRSISRLKKLNTLRLQKNPLRDIEPRNLSQLYKLTDLQLPEDIAKTKKETLKDWLPDVDFDKPYWHFD